MYIRCTTTSADVKLADCRIYYNRDIKRLIASASKALTMSHFYVLYHRCSQKSIYFCEREIILFAALQCLRTPDGIDAALRDCWPQSFQHNTVYNLIKQLTTGREAASETESSVEAAVWYLIAIFGQLPQTSVSRQRKRRSFL